MKENSCNVLLKKTVADGYERLRIKNFLHYIIQLIHMSIIIYNLTNLQVVRVLVLLFLFISVIIVVEKNVPSL